MYFDKYVMDFDIENKTLDSNFKKNAMGSVGLSILEMVEEGNIIKLESVKGEETVTEYKKNIKVEDEKGKVKNAQEKRKKNIYRVTVNMTKVPKSDIKSKSCGNPFNAGARNSFNAK